MIVVVNDCDIRKWDEFVFNHPDGCIYQTSIMKKVYNHTKNYSPISLAAVDSENGDLLGVLQASLISEFSGPFKSFTSRSVIHGGPLTVGGEKGLEVNSELILHYDNFVRNKVVYSEIRNMWDTSREMDLFVDLGYDFTEHLNAYIDLSVGVEELWDNLKRDKKRGIKKAENEGIFIEVCLDKSELPLFYSMIKETYINARIPLADYSLFESAFDFLVPQNNALFIFAKNCDGEPIAAQVALMYKSRIIAWYTGAVRTHLKYHPGDSLIWYLLKYGSENKYCVFDFGGGGSSTKNQNLTEYKSRFGVEFEQYGRYKKIHSSSKNSIASTGLSVYKKCVKYGSKISSKV